VYFPEASIEKRRFIAQKFIDVTLRSFRLRAEDRHCISVEFISTSPVRRENHIPPTTENGDDLMVEVIGHDLTEERKHAFSGEAAAVLDEFFTPRWQNRITRFFGIETHTAPKIAFRFGELNPAVSEPFVVHPSSLAA
jgi:hypothetical protein